MWIAILTLAIHRAMNAIRFVAQIDLPFRLKREAEIALKFLVKSDKYANRPQLWEIQPLAAHNKSGTHSETDALTQTLWACERTHASRSYLSRLLLSRLPGRLSAVRCAATTTTAAAAAAGRQSCRRRHYFGVFVAIVMNLEAKKITLPPPLSSTQAVQVRMLHIRRNRRPHQIHSTADHRGACKLASVTMTAES